MQKIATDYWGQMILIHWFKARCTKEKPHNEHSNILCQQAVDSISKESFNRCLQSFLSICQTLLLRKLAKPGCKKISLFACLWSNLHSPRLPFQVFNLSIPFTIEPPLSGFQLDLYFSFSLFYFFIFLWFKLPFRVFTLNLFLFLFCFFFFSLLYTWTALSSFQLW